MNELLKNTKKGVDEVSEGQKGINRQSQSRTEEVGNRTELGIASVGSAHCRRIQGVPESCGDDLELGREEGLE